MHESVKMSLNNEEKNRDLIIYREHLRHLYKIDNRPTRYPTYKMKFKCEEEKSPIINLKEEIKRNKQILAKSASQSRYEFDNIKAQVDLIKQLELFRIKQSNQKLKSLVDGM